MKNLIQTIACAGLLCLLAVPGQAAPQSSDRAAVDAVMQTFLSAYKNADGTLVAQSFMGNGVMIGYSPLRQDGLVSRTGEQVAQGFNGTPAANEAQRKRSYQIVDMAENLAAVRVTLDYPGWEGVDYFVLLKKEGKWMIASKTWTGKASAPKP